MSEPTSSSSGGAYGEAVKWILTIATAAIAGAFLHLKEIEVERWPVQIAITIALAAFVVCVWAGMNYLFWLNLVPLRKDAVKEAQNELTGIDDQSQSEAPRRQDLGKRIESYERDLANAKETMPTWHRIFTYAFTGALALSTVGILTSITMHAYSAADGQHIRNPHDSRARFHIVYSAIHSTTHGKEAHTFLMNDETGALWQMICQDKDQVAFRKVPVLPEPEADK